MHFSIRKASREPSIFACHRRNREIYRRIIVSTHLDIIYASAKHWVVLVISFAPRSTIYRLLERDS